MGYTITVYVINFAAIICADDNLDAAYFGLILFDGGGGLL